SPVFEAHKVKTGIIQRFQRLFSGPPEQVHFAKLQLLGKNNNQFSNLPQGLLPKGANILPINMLLFYPIPDACQSSVLQNLPNR
ncbi:MAG TPA: hypothetical protein PK777_09785, partial [Thermoguttaceae bacterium]|nr:hypothetical protein [Thermoguttaceae bacterium]HPP53229.1 hypothetical protein [Thermoguttaceae bacterium]